MPVTSALGKWRQEEQELKVNLNYIGSSRSARDTRGPVLRKEKEKKKEEKEGKRAHTRSGLYDSIWNS